MHTERHDRSGRLAVVAMVATATAVFVAVISLSATPLAAAGNRSGARAPSRAIARTPRPTATRTRVPAPEAPAPVVLSFAGYPWTVKSSTTPVGPGPNLFDAYGPYVDRSGVMHLRIVDTPSGWQSSEVILDPSVGYGTYTWTVRGQLSNLDPNAVLALFTYPDSMSATDTEVDFEASRFGWATEPTNAQYVVQPFYAPGHLQRITLTKGYETTVSMTWSRNGVSFSGETVRRNGRATALPTWSEDSPFPLCTCGEQVHMSLWSYLGVAPADGRPISVAVTGFRYAPGP
jgi:hypothetical protein